MSYTISLSLTSSMEIRSKNSLGARIGADAASRISQMPFAKLGAKDQSAKMGQPPRMLELS